MMLRCARLLPVILAVSGLAACSSATKSRVIELEDGKTASIGTAPNEPDAVIAAVDRANEFCAEQKKKPVFPEASAGENEKKRSHINFSKIPMIGGAFEEEKPKVVMKFACK